MAAFVYRRTQTLDSINRSKLSTKTKYVRADAVIPARDVIGTVLHVTVLAVKAGQTVAAVGGRQVLAGARVTVHLMAVISCQ